MSGVKRSQARPLRKAVTYLLEDEMDWVIKTKDLLGVSISNLLATMIRDSMEAEVREVQRDQRNDNNQREDLPW